MTIYGIFVCASRSLITQVSCPLIKRLAWLTLGLEDFNYVAFEVSFTATEVVFEWP